MCPSPPPKHPPFSPVVISVVSTTVRRMRRSSAYIVAVGTKKNNSKHIAILQPIEVQMCAPLMRSFFLHWAPVHPRACTPLRDHAPLDDLTGWLGSCNAMHTECEGGYSLSFAHVDFSAADIDFSLESTSCSWAGSWHRKRAGKNSINIDCHGILSLFG